MTAMYKVLKRQGQELVSPIFQFCLWRPSTPVRDTYVFPHLPDAVWYYRCRSLSCRRNDYVLADVTVNYARTAGDLAGHPICRATQATLNRLVTANLE